MGQLITAQHTRRSRRGFTLIELLVVVSIIALLVAILLPSLVEARQTTLKVLCGTNLHQVGVSAFGYAQENQENLPTFFRSSTSFTTYWMAYPGKGLVSLGLLTKSKYTMTPDIFYCPWKERLEDEALRYDSPDNPWGSDKFRTAFPSRLLYSDQAETKIVPANKIIGWRVGDYANKVIYSDFVGTDGFKGGGIQINYIYAPHRGDGFNMLFGDGSVTWANPGKLTSNITNVGQPTITQAAFYKEMDTMR
ncbi:MAG: prepilin-type N-terminal cleavage/methylation domain-containing protein [Phycisphaera sp.]|nr:prepilin-type N-terminal cleavage/methylation domain-containing protein [Phycisphaera sp.]